MISRSTNVRAALRSRQRGFLLNPARFGGGGGGGGGGGIVSVIDANGASYANTTSISSPSTPAGVTTGDGLFAILYGRSALTPPAGWTLIDSQAVVDTVTQTLYIYRRDSAGSGDSSTAFTWTQAASGRMGLSYLLARSDTGSLTVAETAKLQDTAATTNTIVAPVLTATEDGELFLLAATTVFLNSAQPWGAPSGATLRTTATQADNRLGYATQSRDDTQSNSSPFTLDSARIYAAITARIQAV